MVNTFQIKINENSRVPKFKQIVDFVIEEISKGNLKLGEKIPSINELSETCSLSRDTVEKAYRQLKEQKVILSVKGKGYYAAKTDLISKINVLFLVNKPSTYKMIIYDSFVKELGVEGHVTLSVYHCEETLFQRTLEKSIGAYDYYVIMPHFKNETLRHVSSSSEVITSLEKLPKDKLVILDNLLPEIKGNFGAIYQDFREDIRDALKESLQKLKKYDKLILVYPNRSIYPYPRRILFGFQQFCVEQDFDFEILEEIYDDMELRSKDVYIIIQERDLVNLVRQVRAKNLILGKDIGIISYNDTPLKELLDITVISTEFKAMGETAAFMILKKKKEKVKNVFRYIERNSL